MSWKLQLSARTTADITQRRTFQHEAIVADSGVEELGHEAEADVERKLHLHSQLLSKQQRPVV